MLKIAAAQYSFRKHSSFNDFQAHVEEWVEEASKNNARLLVFPEYGSIELVSLMPKEIQENLSQQLLDIQNFRDDFLNCYIHLAKKYNVYIIVPSFPWQESDGDFINRAFFVNPDGLYSYQDKQMMTRFEDEKWGMSRPPSCTETAAGMNRVHVGARARALENQIYVVVAQTVGEVDYSEAIDFNTGHAAIYSTCDKGFPDDGIIVKGSNNYPEWVYGIIDLELIKAVRVDGGVLNFKRMKTLL
jgi:predicted amidohydrolase